MILAAVLIATGITIDRFNTAKFLSDLRLSLESESRTIQAHLEGNIIEQSSLIRGFAATIESNPDISQERYARLAAQLTLDDPSILNIAAAPDFVVKYVYPLQPNKGVLGFNYRTSEVQFKQVERARRLNSTVFDGPVELVQGGRGFIVRSPVFPIDEATGKRSFWGIVSIVIDVGFLDNYSNAGPQAESLEIALRKTNEGPDTAVFFGNDRVFKTNPLLSNITLPNGVWTMGVIPKGGWPARAENYLPLRLQLLLIGGVLFFLTCYTGWLFEKRRHAEQILTRAVEAIDGGFVLYEADGTFVASNKRYKEIYSLSADLFVPGVTFEHIIREGMKRGEYPSITEQKEEWIKWRLERHKLADLTDEHCLPNGRWIRVSESKLANGGTVGIHIDITDQVLAKKAAEKGSQAKSVFLSTLGHELRTPLTMVLGFAQILQNIEILPAVKDLRASLESTPFDAAEAQAKLTKVLAVVNHQSGRIHQSGSHLLTMISDILDFSKADAGEMKFDKQMIFSGPLVESVVEQFEGIAKEKNLRLSYQPSDELLFADEVRAKQILINLIGNALKFTDVGSVSVKTQKKGDMVEFSVEDTGCGISESEISDVFNEFYQVNASDTRELGGTGLGLSIVKRMVEGQGGSIEVSSVLGKGSVFKFSLPSQ